MHQFTAAIFGLINTLAPKGYVQSHSELLIKHVRSVSPFGLFTLAAGVVENFLKLP
jgi:hypothetical protein